MLRHSTAHVLAQAVCDVYPGAKYAIGPAIEDGFYYDFDLPEPLQPADLAKIDRRMRQIVEAEPAVRPRGHLARRSASHGWRTSRSRSRSSTASKRRRPRRVRRPWATRSASTATVTGRTLHGPARASHGQARRLQAHESRGRLLARRRFPPHAHADLRHRVGDPGRPGRPPRAGRGGRATRPPASRGSSSTCSRSPRRSVPACPSSIRGAGSIRRLMEDYSRRRHEEAGYEFVNSPHITKSDLFVTSGHLDWFAEGMFPPMELDDGSRYYLKPMNCPMHILIYRSRTRSYRELPLRLFEFGTVYRYEKSGVVHGLTRVRGVTRTTPTSSRRRSRWAKSCARSSCSCSILLRDYGLDDFYLELSTKPEGKAVGTDEEWAEGIEILRQAAESMDLKLVMDEGGGAFYGPKISVQAKDAIGRTWQMSTIQVDFQLPAALRPALRGRRRRAPPAGHDPPRALRFGGALLRRADRALRGRVPAVARTRATALRARGRPARRALPRARDRARGRPGCARASTTRRRASARRSARRS